MNILLFTVYPPVFKSTHSHLNRYLFTMPKSNNFEKALSAIKDDTSKVLGMKVGKHENVQPGTYIPRAGELDLECYYNHNTIELTNLRVCIRRPVAPRALLPGPLAGQDLHHRPP